MSTWPISPLTPATLDFAVVDYSFSSLTADELSPLPNIETAIDSTLLDFAGSLADQTVLIDSMAGDLDDLGAILDELASDDFEQIAADLAGIAAAGDGFLNDLTSLFG